MAQPKKRATRARKCKCKCHIKEKAQIVKKGQQIGKNGPSDTIPTKVPSNSAVFRVKVKKK